MKKMLLKVLCMVLIITLLAPNVFAAASTPETPLADAATVARVKQEIAAGEITDMEDLFHVAYQHLGANLEEEGMTAYINDDGTLGVTQIISNSDVSVCSLGSDVQTKTLAVMSLGIFDNEGELLSDYSYYNQPYSASTSDSQGYVYVTHTMNITVQYTALYDPDKVHLNSIATQISHSSTNYLTSRLVQEYTVVEHATGQTYTGSQPTTWPGSGTHTYYVGDTGWHNPSSGTPGGYILTASTLTVTNISAPIHIDLRLDFVDGGILS